MTPKSAPSFMWVYPWDLLDEGVEAVLDRIHSAWLGGVAVATWYHTGMFLLPHNPRRKLYFPEPGALYYRPDPAAYGKLRIRPPVSPLAETDLWSRLRAGVASRGMELSAWLVVLHSTAIGRSHPECTVENAWGDRVLHSPCAAHPDVREMVVTLVQDVAVQTRVDRVVIESLEYLPLRHGFHHEVMGIPLTPAVAFLSSLCFCEHCQRRSKAEGVDAGRVRQFVRDTVEAYFRDPFTARASLGGGSSAGGDDTWGALKAGAGGEMTGYLKARQATLTSLLREVSQAVRSRTTAKIGLVDFGPLYELGPDEGAWENGVHLPDQAALVDEVHPTFYFADPERIREKATAYFNVLQNRRPAIAAMRAILPQLGRREQLGAQLAALKGRVEGFSFYNYGFMAYPTLDWIREALAMVAR